MHVRLDRRAIAKALLLTCATIAAFLSSTHASETLPEGEFLLGPIRAHLFYKDTGRLSEELLAREPPFVAWNTVIGGGDAEEAADDILFVLPVRANGEQFTADRAHLWVVDAEGKELARREFGSILTSEEGFSYLPLWVEDATCSGELTVHAAFRDQARKAQLTLHCGE